MLTHERRVRVNVAVTTSSRQCYSACVPKRQQVQKKEKWYKCSRGRQRRQKHDGVSQCLRQKKKMDSVEGIIYGADGFLTGMVCDLTAGKFLRCETKCVQCKYILVLHK